MNTYTTTEVAKIIGIHPNTVRMYEEWGLIPLAERKPNGYRIFTDFHIEQLRLARITFQIEVLPMIVQMSIIWYVTLKTSIICSVGAGVQTPKRRSRQWCD